MFHTHPTTTAILKKSMKTIYHTEYHHVAHFSSGGFAVTDKLRIFWTGDVSGVSTLPTSKGLCFPNINLVIPVKFKNQVSFNFNKDDLRAFKAFLQVAKLNSYNKPCRVQIKPSSIVFNMDSTETNCTTSATLQMIANTEGLQSLIALEFNLNFEYLTDFLFGIDVIEEFNTVNLKFNEPEKLVVFECKGYNYLLSLLKD